MCFRNNHLAIWDCEVGQLREGIKTFFHFKMHVSAPSRKISCFHDVPSWSRFTKKVQISWFRIGSAAPFSIMRSKSAIKTLWSTSPRMVLTVDSQFFVEGWIVSHALLINSLILWSLLNSSFLYPGCDREINVSSVGNKNNGGVSLETMFLSSEVSFNVMLFWAHIPPVNPYIKLSGL